MKSTNVPALRRGLEVLGALASRPGPAGAVAIARQLDLPRSTTFHLLNELRRARFVEHFPEKQSYGLGPAALQVGLQHLLQTGRNVQVLVASSSGGEYDVLCTAGEEDRVAFKGADDLLTVELGRQWRQSPDGATVLDLVRAWRREPRNQQLLSVLGDVEEDAEQLLIDGQDHALGQLLGYLGAGELRLVRVELASGAAVKSPRVQALRSVRPDDCTVHVDVDGGAFLKFEGGFSRYTAQRLWSEEPLQPRTLLTPSTIPLACGDVRPMTTLGHVRAQTAVARWTPGSSELVVLVTHPPGTMLRQQHPRQLLELLQPGRE